MNCPEKQVRQSTTQIVLHSINIMIAHHGFTLSVERLKEKSVKYNIKILINIIL